VVAVGIEQLGVIEDTTTPARARTGTIRAQLINTPARIARSAGRMVLHLPRDWPWEAGLDELFRHALHDPLTSAASPPAPRATTGDQQWKNRADRSPGRGPNPHYTQKVNYRGRSAAAVDPGSQLSESPPP